MRSREDQLPRELTQQLNSARAINLMTAQRQGSVTLFLVLTFTLAEMLSSIAMAQTQRELDINSGGGLFARMWRTEACPHAESPRGPSVVRNREGELLLMFASKESQTRKDVLVVARSADGGKTWSDPHTVFTPASGAPTALGTLTCLSSGRLMAPLVDAATVRMLVSDDDGNTWKASDPIDCSPLRQATPYSRLVESGGTLLMSVFGKLPADEGLAPCSGLLRSRDGGKTWGTFTVIACDRAERKVAYGPTAVHADAGGKLLALISVDKTFLYRSLSTDGGHTWSEPDQRLLACNPTLASVGSTLACVDQDPTVRGVIRVQFSHNLFDSWRCDRMLEHFVRGEYASALALDEDHLLLVYDRGGLTKDGGALVTGGIEVVMMQRNPAAPPPPVMGIPPEERDRWELSEEFTCSVDFGTLSPTPDGKLITCSGGRIRVTSDGKTFEDVASPPPDGKDGIIRVLRSGRWVLAASEMSFYHEAKEERHATSPDGYLYWKRSDTEVLIDIRTYYSDDRGQTWQGGKKLDISPLVWATIGGRLFVQDDGTVLMPVYGGLNKEDTSCRLDCSGVFRSTDGGKSWGDFSPVAYDRAHRKICYNETEIQTMPDGTWVALIRTEWVFHGPGEPASSVVCFSTDLGRSWTKPEFAFIGAVPSLVLLPDGGLAWSGSWQRVRISYDGGHTWSRELPSHTTHYANIQWLDKDNLLVHDSGAANVKACIYRRIPAGATDFIRRDREP